MKEILILCLLLINPNYILPASSSYDYSSYTSTSTNTNLSGQTISSTTSGQSAVYITSSGITIENTSITKSGDFTGDTENSEFYGLNAAVLVQGGGLTMTGGTITTSARVSNALVATNGGTVTIQGTTITSTGASSARGLHATYGGVITATNVTISSTGGSCATLATDRGEGTVSCTGCTLSTGGSGSPLIYSTGEITVSRTTGTATAAQAVVVEGKNTANIQSSSNLKCTANGNGRNDDCGILIYQSQSGDADTGTSYFNCDSSTIEILSTSSVSSSAPFFYVTNTDANIHLTNCTLTFGSGVFLLADGGDWGTSGSNGGTVTMTLENQNIEGNIVVGNSSSLTLILKSSTFKGTINSAKTATKLNITMDSGSTITLTGNSYYTSLTNADSDGSNVVIGSYTWGTYEATETSDTTSSSPGSGSGSPPSGSGSPPSGSDSPGGSGSPPSGSGSPPSGSDSPSGSGSPPSGSDSPSGSGSPPSGSGSPPSDSSSSTSAPSSSTSAPSGSSSAQSDSSTAPSGSSSDGSPPEMPDGTDQREPDQSGTPPEKPDETDSTNSTSPATTTVTSPATTTVTSASTTDTITDTSSTATNATDTTTDTSSTTSQTNSTIDSTDNPVVLLGYSHFETNTTAFSFYIYFVTLLNSINSKTLRIPINIDYNRILRNLETTETICTLQDSSSGKKLQYKCEAQADTSNIKQIQIQPNFTFSDQNVNLAGITPLANSYMNNIQEVSKLNYLANSDVYILDHSIFNKYGTNTFNISGLMSDPQPEFGKTDLVLSINTNSSGTVKETNVSCSITDINEKNYTLNCQSSEDIDSNNLQSAYSVIDNDVLLVNFDPQNEEGTNDTAQETEAGTENTQHVRYNNRKSSGGLNGGAIAAIVIAPVVAVASVIGVISLVNKGSVPKANLNGLESTNNALKAGNNIV